jgi:replicative DNA helicase
LGDWPIWSCKIFKKDNRFEMILQRMRREVIQNKTQVFIVDHLWLIVEHRKGISKTDLIGYITWAFKRLAEELWIAILLLSQLNRSGQWDNEPTLSSLRDSGNIEQDANVVMFLYLPPYWSWMDLILAKVRDWEVWKLDIEYDYKTMNVSKITKKKSQ